MAPATAKKKKEEVICPWCSGKTDYFKLGKGEYQCDKCDEWFTIEPAPGEGNANHTY